MPFDQLKRREFITLAGGAAAAWPLSARAADLVIHQPPQPFQMRIIAPARRRSNIGLATLLTRIFIANPLSAVTGVAYRLDGYAEAVTLAHALTLIAGCRSPQRQTVTRPKGRHFQKSSGESLGSKPEQ